MKDNQGASAKADRAGRASPEPASRLGHSATIPCAGANGQAVELLAIGGRVVEVDAEIAPVVAALNAAGLETVASCSGHGHRPADIALADGREIIIARNFDEARKINRLFPANINGELTIHEIGWHETLALRMEEWARAPNPRWFSMTADEARYAASALRAQAIEARRAIDSEAGVVGDESAVAESDAPND